MPPSPKSLNQDVGEPIDVSVNCTASGATPIIVAMRIPPNYGPRYTRAFDGVFAEVAAAKDTRFVPFLLADVALADNLMQDDGIHPTAEAQPLLLDAVWTHLQELL